MADFLEDYPSIIVPMGEGGENVALGSYYNCSTLTITHAPLENPEVEVLPINTLRYDLKHVKDTKDKEQNLAIGLELVVKALMLPPFTIGSVQYSTKYTSKIETDHVQVYYSMEKEVRRLTPSDEVIQRLNDRETPTDATHIITEIYYGVHVLGDILITSKQYNKLVKKSAVGLGAIIIGPISTAIEAALSALLGNPGNGTDVEISIDSTHSEEFGAEPTAAEVFAAIKRLINVTPVPIKMVAVPVKHLILTRNEPSVIPLFPPFILNALKDAIQLLKDYADYEDEEKRLQQSAHFTRQIMHKDARLQVILADKLNPITGDVKATEGRLRIVANSLFARGETLIEGLTTGGATTLTQIEAFLTDFDKDFSLTQIAAEIQEYVTAGREQLYLIQANDVDEFTQTLFAATETTARSLAAQIQSTSRKSGEDVLVVELRTGRVSGQPDPPSALFLQIYDLRSPLLQFIVVLPNMSGGKFALTFPNLPFSKEYVYSEEHKYDDILSIVELLAVGFGSAVGSGPATRFYQAVAATPLPRPPVPPEWPSIGLPVRNPEHIPTFHAFLEAVNSRFIGVQIFSTFMSLKYFVQTEPKLIILLPTRGMSSLATAIKAFDRLLQFQGDNHNLTWAVGDLDLDPVDAEGPLLLLFKGGKLLSQCQGWLDFLHLEYLVTYELDKLGELKGTNCTFSPNRTEVFLQTQATFTFSFYRKPTLVLHPLRSAEIVPEPVRDAVAIVTAYLDTFNQTQAMITALVRILLHLSPSFASTLVSQLDWSLGENRFPKAKIFNADPETRRTLRWPFLSFLYTYSPILSKVGGILTTLEFAIQSAKLANADPFVHVNRIPPAMINELASIDATLVEELKGYLNAVDLKKAQSAYTLLAEKILLHSNLIEGNDVIAALQDILSIIPPPTQEEDPAPEEEQAKLASSRNNLSTFPQILKKYVLRVGWDPEVDLPEIEELLKNDVAFNILHRLNSLLYPKWHREMTALYEAKITSYTEHEGLMEVIIKIDVVLDGPDPKEYEYHFIWSNPAFSHLVLRAIEDEERSRVLYERLKTQVGSYISFPPYIPAKVVSTLRRAHMGKEKQARVGGQGSEKVRAKVVQC